MRPNYSSGVRWDKASESIIGELMVRAELVKAIRAKQSEPKQRPFLKPTLKSVAVYNGKNIAYKALRHFIRTHKGSYQAYLKSPYWQDLKQRIKEAFNYTCQQCGTKVLRLNVHHKTYKRIGNEQIEDLILLCEFCHKKTHGITR